MTDRRTILRGLATLPLAAGASSSAAASDDRFPGYLVQLHDLDRRVNTSGIGDAAADVLMDEWGALDRRVMQDRPSTLAGVVACLEYARREQIEFHTGGGAEGDNPAVFLTLKLIENALDALRPMASAAGGARA